jgi:hypothetical protein
MKRSILYGTIFAAMLATTVTTAAQEPQAPPTANPPAGSAAPRPDQDRSQADRSPQVTMTGCLQRDDQGSPSPAGSPTATSGSSSFVLANATRGTGTSGSPAAGGATPPSPGGATSTTGASMSFKLEGGNKADLTKYVNSQVEIRGKLDSKGSAAAGGAPTGNPPSAASRDMQTLQVDSVKQVAASCTAK